MNDVPIPVAGSFPKNTNFQNNYWEVRIMGKEGFGYFIAE